MMVYLLTTQHPRTLKNKNNIQDAFVSKRIFITFFSRQSIFRTKKSQKVMQQ